MDVSMIPSDNPIPALLEFIPLWISDLSACHRVDPSVIPSFVPKPLRAIYELTGNWPVPFAKQWRAPNWVPGLLGLQDQLLPLDQLHVEGDRFTFVHENQGVWSCETIANEEDPPVYSDSLSFQTGTNEMQEVCSKLSHFMTTYCLQELTFRSQFLFSVDDDVQSPADLVTAELLDFWPDGVYVYREPTHSFYICDRRLMVMNAGEGYWIAYNDPSCDSLVREKSHIRRIN